MSTTVENTGDTSRAQPSGPATAGPGAARVTVWIAGFIVTVGAGVLTAHGLFGVAVASDVAAVVAWLYPLITDGLALVAYVATTLLVGHGRAYAWCVVVLAAALSGLAQASFLAGGVQVASTVLRFGVGAWPAIAAALAAHLLFLIGSAARRAAQSTSPYSTVSRNEVPMVSRDEREGGESVSQESLGAISGVPDSDSGDQVVHGVQGVQPGSDSGVQRGTPDAAEGVSPAVQDDHPVYEFVRAVRGVPAVPNDHQAAVVASSGGTPGGAHGDRESVPLDGAVPGGVGVRLALSPGDRAVALAELHRRRRDELPSVRELSAMAKVGQGTAARALKELAGGPADTRPSTRDAQDVAEADSRVQR